MDRNRRKKEEKVAGSRAARWCKPSPAAGKVPRADAGRLERIAGAKWITGGLDLAALSLPQEREEGEKQRERKERLAGALASAAVASGRGRTPLCVAREIPTREQRG
ncbi:hypothetical protein VPH35_083144 [Triticum aestivum]